MTPRYTTYPFPPYSYVTGLHPHPKSHPNGHGCPGPTHQVGCDLFQDWRVSETYLWAVDLFNYGYYWEAHEAWEELWHDAGPKTSAGYFLQALIKLAAAGVKAREVRSAGIQRHARRAGELLRQATADFDEEALAGLRLSELREFISWLEANADIVSQQGRQDTAAATVIVFDFVLKLTDGPRGAEA